MIKAVRICRFDLESCSLTPAVIYNRSLGYPGWKATCLKKHKAPREDCKCGLYSTNNAILIFFREDIGLHVCDDYYTGHAVVIVECLGKTIKHSGGQSTIIYRSEIQLPQVIFLPRKLKVDERSLSTKYDCNVVRLEGQYTFQDGMLLRLL